MKRGHLEALSYLFDAACFGGGGGGDGARTNGPVLTPVLGKFLMTRNLTVSSSSSSGGGGGGSTATKTNESGVLRAVLKDAKEIVGQIRKKRDEWSFARANFASDFTANYRRKIGHPLLAKLPFLSSSQSSREQNNKALSKVYEFIVDPFSFYKEVCVILFSCISRGKRRRRNGDGIDSGRNA